MLYQIGLTQLDEIRGETEYPTKRYVILPRGRGGGFNEVVHQLRTSYQKVIQYLAYTALAIPALPPALFPFFQPYTFGKTTLFEIIVEVMALVWLAWRISSLSQKPAYASFCDKEKKRTVSIALAAIRPTRSHLVGIAVTAFAGFTTLSAIFSTDGSASFWGSSARMDGLFTLLHFFAFFIILASLFDKRAFRRCMQISVIAGIFAALYAVVQWFDLSFVVASKGEIFGTLGNPSYLALYLLFTIFLAHYLAQNEKRREVAIILYCAVAIQTIALLLTQVQAAPCALAVGAVVAAYPYIRARITLRRGIIALAALGVFIFLFSFSANFAKLASLSEGSASLSNRMAVWNIALSGIAEKPLLGHGANNFEPYYLAQKNTGAVPLPATGETFDKPHNAYLEIAFSYGIVWLVAYLFLLWTIIRRAWRAPALAGACIGYFVFLFFFFDTFASLLMFFFVAAYLFSSSSSEENNAIASEKTLSPAMLVVSGIALTAIFFAFHFKPLYSAYFARQFLLQAETGVIDETLKASALRHNAFNTPFIERAILLTERAMKK
ncbi:MAG: O-antigen ligase family protein [Patescibacteria group bacterium]